MAKPTDRFLLRLVVASLAPLVLAVVVQATFAMVMQRRAMVKGLEAKASSLAELMVNVVGPSIALDDPKAVQEALGYVENDPDFAFSLALGPDGNLMGYRARKGEPERHPAKTELVSVGRVVDEGDLMVVAFPVRTGSRIVGTIYLGLRASGVRAQTTIISAWAALISLAGVVIATLVVRALASKVVARSREMALLLDNVDQGFLTMTPSGILQKERSAVATRWLGRYRPNQTFWDALGTIDPAASSWFEVGWQAVLEDDRPLALVLDQLAKRASCGDRTLRIECKPLMTGDRMEQVLVVLSDITIELARERAEALERDLMRMLERMSRDRCGFLEFLDDANDLVQRVGAQGSKWESRNVDPVFARDVHTLKGNAGLFGISSVATACKRIEDALAQADALSVITRTHDLIQTWEGLQVKLGSLFGDHKNLPEIEPADLEQLEGLLVSGAPPDEVTALVASWRSEPTELRLRRAAHQIRYLAWNLGKRDVNIEVESNRMRLDSSRWQPFWRVFVHVLRNTADHGIDDIADRRAAGKPDVATVWLRTFKEQDRFILEVEDDGRGIDWQAMRERAEAAGLPASTPEHLEEALFSDGISTATKVSEVSGRGMGLAAVRQECRRMGGEVNVTGTPGRGARFRFSWPLHAMTSSASLRTAA
jgi:two-component system, chemotaxis family, sensor kinase CheA